MIKPNHLRIGNLVLLNGKITEVTAIDDTGLNGQCFHESMEYDYEFNPENVSWDYGKLEPIELTPEIIEKCGFKITGTDTLGGWIVYQNGVIEFKCGFGGCHLQNKLSITVFHFMHELQNIVHALTGEELEIKDLK